MRGFPYWMTGEQSQRGIRCGLQNPQSMLCDNERTGNDVLEFPAVTKNIYLIAIFQSIDIRKWSVGTRAVTTDNDVALGSKWGCSP